MSDWRVSHEQWLAWVGAEGGVVAPVTAPRDDIDASLVQSLSRTRFPGADEETVSRPVPETGPGSFESMTTLIRNSVDDDEDVDEDDATRMRPDPVGLDVELVAPNGRGLEVSLVGNSDLPTRVTERPAATEGTVVAESIPAPPPAASAEPEAPAAEPGGEPANEGLFIPALTRTPVEPAATPASDEPPPDELPPAVTGDTVIGSMDDVRRSSGPSPVGMPPVPTAASGQTAVPPPAAGRATPPAVTGQTVVGPPPEPPAELFEDDSASISKTSGVIMMEEDEAAQTLIRGEIPAEEPVRSSPKVVIDPSASGLMERVYDDEDEPTAVESEPDELDAEDLVEEEPEPEPPAVTEAGPPPAPAASSGPPPAPEAPPRAAPPPVPASLDTGPPPPPVATASIDAAVASIAAAPATDEGWQVDAFGEHYAALLSPNRAVSASADVDFMLHCMGLARGATVLDVGCGDGAHAVAMATRGMAVTGLDPAPAQLMRASQAAASAGVAVNLVNGDMRQMPGGGPFDAVICVGGTLGLYSDEEDRRAVTEMRDRLAPGGRLMLHVLNRDYIVGRLPARSWWQGQGCLVLDEAQLYAPRSIVHVHRTVVFETGTQFEHNMGLRVYGLTELVYLCAQVGLTVLEYSGSRHTRGRFYGATSSEIWLLAQRTD